MDRSMVTEIATFQAKEGVDAKHFTAVVHDLEIRFHAKQKGYLDSELLHDSRLDQWILIQHWQTFEDAKNSSKNMMREEVTEEFRSSIIPETVTLKFSTHVACWKE